jgi:hypothetical protein
MKKLILMLTVCTFAMAGTVSAQKAKKPQKPKREVLATGKVVIQVVDGTETVELVRKDDTFSELMFTDAAGKKTRLVPARGVIPGAPGADCDSRSPVQYFNNSTSTIGLIICKGEQAGSYYITLDLPGGGTSKAQNRRVEVKLSK